jgi:hypothetical protein
MTKDFLWIQIQKKKRFCSIVQFTTNIWYIFGHFTHFFCGISYFWVRFMGGTELSCPGLTSFLLGPLPFPYNMIICGNPAIYKVIWNKIGPISYRYTWHNFFYGKSYKKSRWNTCDCQTHYFFIQQST